MQCMLYCTLALVCLYCSNRVCSNLNLTLDIATGGGGGGVGRSGGGASKLLAAVLDA